MARQASMGIDTTRLVRAAVTIPACGLFGAAVGAVLGGLFGGAFAFVSGWAQSVGALPHWMAWGCQYGALGGFVGGIIGRVVGGAAGWSLGCLVGGSWCGLVLGEFAVITGAIGGASGMAIGQAVERGTSRLAPSRWLARFLGRWDSLVTAGTLGSPAEAERVRAQLAARGVRTLMAGGTLHRALRPFGLNIRIHVKVARQVAPEVAEALAAGPRTELEAASAPEGRGTEPEATTTPAGRGTEPMSTESDHAGAPPEREMRRRQR